MNSLGPHVQFLVKLVRTALMCKFNINPRESSLLPVSACRSGLSLSQQGAVGVCTVLMSVVEGGICCWMFVGWCTWGSAAAAHSSGCLSWLGWCGRTHNPRQLCNSALHVFTDWLEICYCSEVQWRGELVLKQWGIFFSEINWTLRRGSDRSVLTCAWRSSLLYFLQAFPFWSWTALMFTYINPFNLSGVTVFLMTCWTWFIFYLLLGHSHLIRYFKSPSHSHKLILLLLSSSMFVTGAMCLSLWGFSGGADILLLLLVRVIFLSPV